MNASPTAGRVAVAMSGGVDSSAAAALLVEQGYEVIGVHLKLHDTHPAGDAPRRCCSLNDSLDARQVCGLLGIPFYVLDFQSVFQNQVMRYFVESYHAGLTPNPCAMCNRTVKHGLLLEKIREFGCERLATGHYARMQHDPKAGWQLLRSRDAVKDQSYFLFHTRRETLPQIMYPLAELEKPEVRKIAQACGFSGWNKPDSQEICFVPRAGYRAFIANQARIDPSHAASSQTSQAQPILSAPGYFVDAHGRTLGRHLGLANYTIGQRRGLGLGGGMPRYVVDLLPSRNQVVLGAEPELYRQTLCVREVNWVSRTPPTAPIQAQVQVRHRHAPQAAWVIPCGASRVRVEFETPVRSIAPGQAAVFYSEAVLLGGGWIERPVQASS